MEKEKFDDKAHELMVSARLNLIQTHVFFGAMAMRLELVQKADLEFTAATDGKRLYYHPQRMKECGFQKVKGIIVHEALHVIYCHHLRKGKRNHMRWNKAGDYVINLRVKEQRFELPEGILYDTKYTDKNTEQVYDLLEDEPEDGKGKNEGRFDDVMDGKNEDGSDMSEGEIKAEEAQIRADIQNAAALARKAGQMTGSLEQLVEATCVPKANWRSILQDFVSAAASTDYNWAKPDKRMMAQYGVVMPSLDGLKLGKCVLLNDASGSCSREQEQFASELSAMLEVYEIDLTVIHHDTKVTNVEDYTQDDLPITMHPRGFGGTCPISAYKMATEEYRPELIIHLTDLEMSFDRVPEPECPVLIACTSKNYLKQGPKWAIVIDIT